jgi:oxysterol-binding protein-related protein 3/6/7
MPAYTKENFNFTNFALSLNECSAELKAKLPITDARLRPDQRAMECGEWANADLLKESLEKRQRENRKSLVAKHAEKNDTNSLWWV